MEKKEYLSEEEYQKNAKKLKKIGLIVLIIGIIVLIGGTVLAIAAVGGVLMFVAHGREIKSFATQQAMPIAQEGIEKMTPTVSNAAESISKGVAKGIAEGKKEAATDDEIEHL